MASLDEDYLLLDIGPDSSPDEIRDAYLILVQVWHPDRFAGKPLLAAKATAKAQHINAAYARIRHAPLRQASPARVQSSPTSGRTARPGPDPETLRQKLGALRSTEGWTASLVDGARALTLDCETCGVPRQHLLMQVPYGVSLSPPIFHMFMSKPWWSSHKGYFLVCDTCADAFTAEQDLADKLMAKQ